jgi:hypothetical protein
MLQVFKANCNPAGPARSKALRFVILETGC